ncbi:inorganic phosphate transporter [Priestia taiwanensis]|uniref:Sulfate permease CysP n=1 Tax=Priestia taiwanensis TaxID=1347902 RepID=A0A917ASP8_9BACI|nr:inorganic phosphate transporter [Priestia taiwanensis]MBM7364046.1 sulfate permease [Priestia taiwanensis]GGE71187.1 sulfate permease CysP [Priestia taiwanensis]
MLIIMAFIIAFFFAMNIGASGGAAAMGVAYASGSIKNKNIALILCGICIVIGSVVAGDKVTKTISSGIAPQTIFTVEVVVVTLIAATLSLFIANMLGIPLSTSEITIGAVAGVGIAFEMLYIQQLVLIIMFWFIVPVVAFGISYVTGKGILSFTKRRPHIEAKWKKPLTFLVILAACAEAFSAGMKNVANAIGPLVSANLLGMQDAALYGGLFVALGAFLLGRKVLETNGKKITSFTLLEGIAISTTSAALVITGALYGLPLPITQITTSSIIGIGSAKNGAAVLKKGIVVQMLKVWFAAPFLSMVIAYVLVKVFIQSDFYAVAIVVAVFLATIGLISLVQSIRQERRSIHENGGGI